MTRSNWGHIEYVAPGRYRVYWQENGEPKKKRIRGTRDDAEVYLAKARLRILGVVEDQPWKNYWRVVVEPSFEGLQKKTISEYERLWNRELLPRVGDVYVSQTTWRLCQSVIDSIDAPSVQRAVARLWKKMCNMAVKDTILLTCPIDRTMQYKPRKKRVKSELDVTAIPDLLDAIRGIKYEKLFLLELGGGLSHEEACAMVKENISRFDYRGRTYAIVKVERGLVVVDGKKHLKGTKNEFRERLVVIGAPFAERLLEGSDGEGAICPAKPKEPDEDYTEEHFASPTTITHNWRDWCKRKKVAYIRPGDMRTIWSTLHGEAGSQDSVVQLTMGHSDGTTRGINYQQRTKRAMLGIADMLTDYILDDHEELF